MTVPISPSLLADLRAVQGIRLWAKAPLAPFTTIGTGGEAALLLTVSDHEALTAALQLLERSGLPWTCLGAGSNLLVADRGYPGIVLKLDDSFHYLEGIPSGRDRAERERQVTVTVGAGAFLARLATVLAENGLSGLEFVCGIPGSVGGATAMNAGAHGRELAEVAEAIEVVSPRGAGWLSAQDLSWDYRTCALPQAAIVTAIKLRLTGGDPGSILETQRSLLRKRRISQPRGVRTFGSVFKNPPGESAGRLLEASGLKGMRRGGAEVSTVHANFLVNLGDATTAEMLVLMGQMREAVERTSGILLEPEVKLLGVGFPWIPAGQAAAKPSGRHG